MSVTGEAVLRLRNERSNPTGEGGAVLATGLATGLAADVGALVDLYGTLLFRVAYSVVRSRSEAEDVVQDVFVRVLEHRGSLPRVRDLRVWMVRIAWNLALDRRRKVQPEQMDAAFLETLAAQSVPADHAFGEARRLALLLEAIERLPKLERQVLLLSAVEELSIGEITEIVGRSESATRSLLHRARLRLKQRIEQTERKMLRKGGSR